MAVAALAASIHIGLSLVDNVKVTTVVPNAVPRPRATLIRPPVRAEVDRGADDIVRQLFAGR